jgi:hypothetical protein
VEKPKHHTLVLNPADRIVDHIMALGDEEWQPEAGAINCRNSGV